MIDYVDNSTIFSINRYTNVQLSHILGTTWTRYMCVACFTCARNTRTFC